MKLWARRLVGRTGSVAMLCSILALLVVPGVARGASVTFGTPSAKSTFGTGIVFTQPFSGGAIQSAEILIDTPGDVGPSVSSLQSPGSNSLAYTLDTSSGGLAPFQPMTARFRVSFADGTSQTGPEIRVVYADDRFTWKAKTGKLVTIHWFQGSDAYATQLLSYGEQGFSKSASFLGVTETQPVDFYVYPSQAAFAAGLSVPETIGGQTQPAYRTCFALVAPTDLAYGSTVVPHELTHIVFNDITDNAYHSPPRWLNEGLAVYLSEGYGSDNRRLVSQAVRSGTLVPLAALAGFFALDATRVYLSYAESVSAVDFMVRKYGQSSIRKLVNTYSTGATDDEAFTAAFGIDTAAFDKAWLADNGVAAPTQYGPQPAPAGPVPPSWTGSSGTVPPAGPTTPPATSSAAPGGHELNTRSSDPTVYLLAGLIAIGGFMLLAVGTLLYVQSERRPPPPTWPPS
jgi:hypothetical protein